MDQAQRSFTSTPSPSEEPDKSLPFTENPLCARPPGNPARKVALSSSVNTDPERLNDSPRAAPWQSGVAGVKIQNHSPWARVKIPQEMKSNAFLRVLPRNRHLLGPQSLHRMALFTHPSVSRDTARWGSRHVRDGPRPPPSGETRVPHCISHSCSQSSFTPLPASPASES